MKIEKTSKFDSSFLLYARVTTKTTCKRREKKRKQQQQKQHQQTTKTNDSTSSFWKFIMKYFIRSTNHPLFVVKFYITSFMMLRLNVYFFIFQFEIRKNIPSMKHVWFRFHFVCRFGVFKFTANAKWWYNGTLYTVQCSLIGRGDFKQKWMRKLNYYRFYWEIVYICSILLKSSPRDKNVKSIFFFIFRSGFIILRNWICRCSHICVPLPNIIRRHTCPTKIVGFHIRIVCSGSIAVMEHDRKTKKCWKIHFKLMTKSLCITCHPSIDSNMNM